MKRNASTDQTQTQAEKLARLSRAKNLLDRRLVVPIFGDEGKFVCFSSQRPVTGPDGIAYLVDLNMKSCTCPDYQKHQNEDNFWCKHMMASWLLANHPHDYSSFLPDWAQGEGKNGQEARLDGKPKTRENENRLGKALAELSDAALARIIAFASAEQQERDYNRAVIKDA